MKTASQIIFSISNSSSEGFFETPWHVAVSQISIASEYHLHKKLFLINFYLDTYLGQLCFFPDVPKKRKTAELV